VRRQGSAVPRKVSMSWAQRLECVFGIELSLRALPATAAWGHCRNARSFDLDSNLIGQL
jgi:hypothetical protein